MLLTNYLIKNKAALIATNEQEIEIQLNNIIFNPTVINEFGKLAYNCGLKNHNIENIQANLYSDLVNISKINS